MSYRAVNEAVRMIRMAILSHAADADVLLKGTIPSLCKRT
jgi:hypothetical protein